MKLVDIGQHIDAIRAAYPYAWPKDTDMKAVIGVWFASFQHVSIELFTAATARMIQECERPSINAMWDAILDVAGVPRMYEMRKCYIRMQDRWHNMELAVLDIEKHPVIVRTLATMGDKMDIAHMKPDSADFKLRESFKENRRAYRARFIQPHGIAALELAYQKTLQITSGQTGKILEANEQGN